VSSSGIAAAMLLLMLFLALLIFIMTTLDRPVKEERRNGRHAVAPLFRKCEVEELERFPSLATRESDLWIAAFPSIGGVAVAKASA
jgi:hypothetical protein